MPVSGNEEVAVKPVMLRNSIDYPAGIPIKKRRYPMIRPQSPPQSEELSSSLVDGDSLQKDQSSPSQGSTLSYASVVTSSSGLSDAIKSAEPEERKESTCVADEENTNVSQVKVEVAGLVQAGTLDNMDKKEVFEAARNPIVEQKKELTLVASESLGFTRGSYMDAKQGGEMNAEAKPSNPLEKTGSLLSTRENLYQVLQSQNSDKTPSDPNHDSSEPISLNLSLSKPSVVSSQSKTEAVNGLNAGTSCPCADRANWDLNTPMDAWVGPLSDLALGQTSLGGTRTITGTGTKAAQAVKPMVVRTVPPKKPVNTDPKAPTSFSSILSTLSGRQLNSDESLRLRLSPGLLSNGNEYPTPSRKLSADKIISNAKLPRIIVPPSSTSSKISFASVKAEPVDESVKLDARGAESSNLTVTNSVKAVKRELVDRSCLESLETPNCLSQKAVDSRPIKREPVLGGTEQPTNSKEANSVHLIDKHSSATVALGTSQTASVVGNSSSPIETENSQLVTKPAEISSLSTECKLGSTEATGKATEVAFPDANSYVPSNLGRDLSSNSDQPRLTNKSCLKGDCEAGESSNQVALDMGSTLTVVGKVDMGKTEEVITENSETRILNVSNDPPLPSRANAASDEEKVNISAENEVSCGSDNESDGNHAVDMSIDMEIDTEEDYEDGEVRVSQECTEAKESETERGHLENANHNEFNSETNGTQQLIQDSDPSSLNIEVVHNAISYATEMGKDGEGASNLVDGGDKCKNESDRSLYLQESTIVEIPVGGAILNVTSNELRNPLDQSGNRGSEEYQESDSKLATNGGGLESLPTFSYGLGLSVNEDVLVPRNDLSLTKPFADVDNEVKDVDIGSHRNTRIINLPRSSESSSPNGTRTFSGRPLPARTGRERFADQAIDGDRIYSRGREDMYFDGTQKFSRERHYDQTHRNARFNYLRGRGRFSNRQDNLRGDRGVDREFASEFRNGPSEFRTPRHKFTSGSDTNFQQYNSYNVSEGGQFVRRMPARRRSPDAPRGTHMVRRISRNISPNRCGGEDGSELARPRRNGRGFQDDNVDPMFSHSQQPSYEPGDGHFSQGNRNFPSGQRRVMHRIRSKSPISSKTRSPGDWSSPRRRSPGGFAGHSDLNHQRPPQFFRVKSPDRRFQGEVVVRRQDSRDMESGRDHGPHQGSGIPPNTRSPSSRIVIRERRFTAQDPQERPEGGDDFYGGPPVNSGRLQELAGDGDGEERRFGERRGPVRVYRSSFNNGTDGESFHVNSDGSRPLRFCPDDTAEFQERGNNLGERDFNRRMKNRPVNPPRQMRSIEEEEVNYRHGNSQVWQNNDIDEMSRIKRKRY